jgi:hypothetical protein
MRIIRFRGIELHTGKWVYGYYYIMNGYPRIITEEQEVFQIKSGTVGQYTGFNDMAGTSIYEGDLCKWEDNYHNKWLDEVHFAVGQWRLEYALTEAIRYGAVEVVGNIHGASEDL